jgi:hypothetical protein
LGSGLVSPYSSIFITQEYNVQLTKTTHFTGVFLFFALLLILGFAIVGTLSLTGVFLFIRLIFHLRSEDGQGVAGWMNETRDRLVPPAMQQYAQNARKTASDYYSAKKESMKMDGDIDTKSELVD